jgi:enoyl-CoA hydratase/3-hydroxyacyl-CoA dehydrogenase
MMLTSQPIKGAAAKKLGLVDELTQASHLLAAAKQLALKIAACQVPRMRAIDRTDRLESLGEALNILEFARSQAMRQARNLSHPQLCLDAIEFGIRHGGRAGLKKVS